MTSKYQKDKDLSFISACSLEYLESVQDASDFKDYNNIEVASWRGEKSLSSLAKKFKSIGNKGFVAVEPAGDDSKRVEDIFATYGHYLAEVSPLGDVGVVPNNIKNIIGKLKGYQRKDLENIYASKIGYEFMHVCDLEVQQFFNDRLRNCDLNFSADEEVALLESLCRAKGLEDYLGHKYVGQKRFSLEGNEALIPFMDEVLANIVKHNGQEVIIGMAHRGRLNVLINTLGKSSGNLFDDFDGKNIRPDISGDVKYHLGYSSDRKINGKEIHFSLAFNPSHLEAVNAVVLGQARAKQDNYDAGDGQSAIVPIIMHGDASLPGQGVVAECLNMSGADAFNVGGVVHIVVNNQVGFTADAHESRSTFYCTDLVKGFGIPVMHVNADCPRSIKYAAQVAIDYRAKFKQDIVVDIIGFRLHGHNEGDEPRATQPTMYHKIDAHKGIAREYGDDLIARSIITQDIYDDITKDIKQKLSNGERLVEGYHGDVQNSREKMWASYSNHPRNNTFIPEKIDVGKLQKLADKLFSVPKNLTLQRQVGRHYKNLKAMVDSGENLNWGFAELLAYATLADSGRHVRLNGQDSQRATFAHRHAYLHDQNNGKVHSIFANIGQEDKVKIYNSVLSEEGPVGFEYGYSTARPQDLVIWEAQFGDFANGAQICFDQFISSGCQKWERYSGLVMLLPHGFEGMGPEHSSARLERFLQLCAQDNMQVCSPTTPAQIYHLLRRQVLRNSRRPLVIMSPKSFLRNKDAVSNLDDLANGMFSEVIDDSNCVKAKVEHVILCSGKVYYDLLPRFKDVNVAIIRIEQLYPFPTNQLKKVLSKYKGLKKVIWVQEEPENQGAWYCNRHNFEEVISSKVKLEKVCRPVSASPAAGYASIHKINQENLLQDVAKHLQEEKGK